MKQFVFNCIAPNGVIVRTVEIISTGYWSAKRKVQILHPGYQRYSLLEDLSDL